MKSLGDFLPTKADFKLIGSSDKKISRFTFDSRNAGPEIAFVARKGSQLDGHDYIGDALDRACTIIICEVLPKNIPPDVSFIQCDNIPALLGKMLAAFYDFDWNEMTLIGVTGTNGKTTVATLLYQLFTKLGYKCGLVSTVEIKITDESIAATHTTPDQIQLFDLINRMKEKKCSHVFMEVSSHALDQGRIDGLHFNGALFTNITHDHLDYHKTFKSYIGAKKKFFDNLSKSSFSLINLDDHHAGIMIQNTKSNVASYAMNQLADYCGRILENSFDGLHLKFDNIEWNSRLVGAFNAYNLLAVYGCAIQLGFDKEEILRMMSDLNPPPGRFDWIKNPENGKVGIVDYAHTPDALEKILKNIIEIKKEHQSIITVVGCGGNRDRSKRPIMANVATILSDQVILTSDNPRFEDPKEIIREMEMGISEEKKHKYLVIEDRTQAIKSASLISKDNDIILVAGKGHETYQEMNGQRLPFDDLKLLKTYLLKL